MDRLYWAYATMHAPERPTVFGHLSPAEIQRYRHDADERAEKARQCWRNSVVDRLGDADSARVPKFTNVMGRAAARRVVDDDSVRWLADNPHDLTEVAFLSRQIGKAAEEALNSLQKRRQHRRLADHFWCDVIGALVRLLEEIEDAAGKLRDNAVDWLVDEVWKRLRHSRETDWGATPNGRKRPGPTRSEHDRGEGVTDILLKDTVKSLLGQLCDGLWAKKLTFDTLILKLRLIAIWLCPDIMAHQLVREHCWVPLTREWVDSDVVDRMARFFPGFDETAAPVASAASPPS